MVIEHYTPYNLSMSRYITKSRILSGLRCPKLLWLQTHHLELAQPSSTSQLTIANGIEIGNMARLNYPDGVQYHESPKYPFSLTSSSHVSVEPGNWIAGTCPICLE